MYSKELYSYMNYFCKGDKRVLINNILYSWDDKKILRFIEKAIQFIQYDYEDNFSYYNFSASSTLSGGLFPCSRMECRMKNVNKLARFASLYADSVTIESPFDKHINSIEKGVRINRRLLADDILLLYFIRSLVESGIIRLRSSYLCLCEECLKEVVDNENEFRGKIKIVNDVLFNEYIRNIKCYIKEEFNHKTLVINGPMDYGFHGSIFYVGAEEIIPELKTLTLESNECHELNEGEIVDYKIIELLTSPIYNDLLNNNYISAKSSTTYLTDRNLDIDIINALRSGLDFQTQTYSSLEHYLPCIVNAPIDKIVKLRCSDGESFKVYRDSINKILGNIDNYDEKTMRDICKDYLYPEINKIDLFIKQNTKHLVKSLAIDVISVLGLVSLGLFSGLIPWNLSAIGGVPFLVDTIRKVNNNIEAKNKTKENSFYFLWKLQNL